MSQLIFKSVSWHFFKKICVYHIQKNKKYDYTLEVLYGTVQYRIFLFFLNFFNYGTYGTDRYIARYN